MQFTKVESDTNFPITKFQSENGRWKLGLKPVLFGVRAIASIGDSDGLEMNHCLGDNQIFIVKAFATIINIFEAFPEEVSYSQIYPYLPDGMIKPITLDCCWIFWQIMEKQLNTFGYQNMPKYRLLQTDEGDLTYFDLQINDSLVGHIELVRHPKYWQVQQFSLILQYQSQLWEEYLLQFICQHAWKIDFNPVLVVAGLIEDVYFYRLNFQRKLEVWYRDAGCHKYALF